MPMPAYMQISDFEGSIQVEGREGHVEILGFDHALHIPTDPKDGTASGTRVHGNFVVLKNYDKATAELYKFLVNGKSIEKIELKWYEITPNGDERVYFTHILEKARVVKVRAWMPNVDDPATERYKHMEEVSFQYEKITWKYEGKYVGTGADGEGGQNEYSDSWISRS